MKFERAGHWFYEAYSVPLAAVCILTALEGNFTAAVFMVNYMLLMACLDQCEKISRKKDALIEIKDRIICLLQKGLP